MIELSERLNVPLFNGSALRFTDEIKQLEAAFPRVGPLYGAMIYGPAKRATGNPGQINYAAAKGGVQTMAKAMARELAPDGIRVNAVAPGLIDTDLIIGKIDDTGKQRVSDNTPLGRLGTPLDIADAFVYLCSDMSRFVTGVILDVSGGMHIH